MPLTVNLRHLENRNLVLRGELPLTELDFDAHDEMIRVTQPLHYDLEIEMLDDCLLVEGLLRLRLDCQCVRCLKNFEFELELDPWTLHLPLEGEDAVSIKNDCVDLTPLVREDILLEFPQHPLCRPDCNGLKQASVGKAFETAGKDESKPAAWAELNKLKL
ncbi:MAG: YceD family protein [Verrucomicrobiales bacterium]|nr:YceD family protein [Verrucomicrobiales bacterium]